MIVTSEAASCRRTLASNISVKFSQLIFGFWREYYRVLFHFLVTDLCSAASLARMSLTPTARSGLAFMASKAGATCSRSHVSTTRSRAKSTRNPSRITSLSDAYSQRHGKHLGTILEKYFQYNEQMDINQIIASRVSALRETQKLSLDALAALSGVSRSNISLIERGQSSASATVLDKLAAALGVSLSSLFEDRNTPAAAPSPVSREAEQLVWTDPASGYVRRILSPAVPSSLQLVEVIFPPGQRVLYDAVERNSDYNQQVWMLDGVMEISVGDQQWRLKAGDCLAMQLDLPFVYFNPAKSAARYLVALVTPPYKPSRRSEFA